MFKNKRQRFTQETLDDMLLEALNPQSGGNNGNIEEPNLLKKLKAQMKLPSLNMKQ